jgi:hypothetical protein
MDGWSKLRINTMPKKMIVLAGLCLISTSVLAQTMSPPEARDNPAMLHRADMLAKFSPAGRQIMDAEMKAGRDKMESSHAARKAARDKVRAAMMAEPYAANVLRSAFEAERSLAGAQMTEHQEHMLSIMGKLSAADRKVFADSMGHMEPRMMMRKGAPNHPGTDMPPPPQN